jgi:heat shock protein HtpX
VDILGIYARITALFFVLTAFLLLIGYLIGSIYGNPFTYTLLFLGLAAVLNFVSYYFSDSLVIRMTHARIIQEGDNPTLFEVVRKVAQKANIPMPRVGVVDSPQPNAFATGRGPKRAVVVATSGILRTLNPSELEAVIGHEVGHVVHRDVLTSSVAATMAGAISLIVNSFLWSTMFGGAGQRNRSNSGSGILALIALILVPLAASFVQLGISRDVEYKADEYGAKLTRNPAGLISALEKISRKVEASNSGLGPNNGANPSPATGSLWIVNPFRGHSLVELFSTHPNLGHRVERLRKVAREIGIYVS